MIQWKIEGGRPDGIWEAGGGGGGYGAAEGGGGDGIACAWCKDCGREGETPSQEAEDKERGGF